MTVLSRYQRLECDGVWRRDAEAQRRDVFVALGEATLVIRDGADEALAHWSLPAVDRVNPGERPALYRPGPDAEETLEIADDTMIDAIRTVQRAVARRRAHPGRLRRAVLAVSLAAALALGALWLPGALLRHTAAVLPTTLRAELGERLLAELAPYAGRRCAMPGGRVALDRLRRAVLGTGDWQVAVVTGGPRTSAHLPGRLILLRRDLLEAASGPEAAAGALLVEAARAEAADPMLAFLRDAGSAASLRLLTRGEIGEAALAAHAERVLVAPRAPLDPGALAARFRDAGVAPGPYLRAARPPEQGLDGLAGATPAETRPLLDDAAWLRLRAICEV